MTKISNETLSKIVKPLLRMLPLLPAPELFELFKQLNDSKEDINQKIEKAAQSLRDASSLIDELQHDLAERTQKIAELKESYEKYAKLAEIEEEKAKPLMKEIEKSLGKGRLKERMWGFAISILAGIVIFILGVLFAPSITSLKNENSSKQIIKKQTASFDSLKIDTTKPKISQ